MLQDSPTKKYQILSTAYSLLLILLLVASVIIQNRNFILSESLDTSWMFTLNYASSNGFLFGKDIVFTFGPLGFITYPITEGLTTGLLITSYIFKYLYILYTGLVVYEMYQSTRLIKFTGLSHFTKFVLLPWLVIKMGFYVDYTIFIFIALIHSSIVNIANIDKDNSSIYNSSKHSLFFIVFNAITCSILLFLKVSFFPFVIAFLSVTGLSLFINKKYGLAAIYVAIWLAVFSITYLSFTINLKDYIINSLDIISGYKKAMQIYTGDNYDKNYLVAGVTTVLFLFQLYKIRNELFSYEQLSKLALILLAVYYCFSYSFTRGSASLFFKCSVVSVILFMSVYLTKNHEAKRRFYSLIIFVLSFGFFNYFYEDINFLTNWNQHTHTERIPNNLIKNSETYDIYPYSTSIAYFNKLTYKPRPIFQSYATYTPKLDSINSRFISQKKVDNIVFHTNLANAPWGNTIDDRYFLYEEPLTKIELLTKYAVEYKVNGALFTAHKRKKDINLKLNVLSQRQYNLDDQINLSKLDTTKLYFFSTDFMYSNKAKITSTFYKFPYISVELTTTDNQKMIFNTVSDLLQHPCVLNKYCANYFDYFYLMQPEKFNSLKNIKSIRFFSNQKGYIHSFNFKIFAASVSN